MTTLVLVDDHGGFRTEARALLEAQGMSVLGEAETGRQALEVARALCPDVVVLDIGLPDLDGFSVAEQLASDDRPPRVVLISSRDAGTYGPRLQASPIAGFVRKEDLSAAVIRSLLAPVTRTA
jgi:DNA-binding NarL/FixJ family response regulator